MRVSIAIAGLIPSVLSTSGKKIPDKVSDAAGTEYVVDNLAGLAPGMVIEGDYEERVNAKNPQYTNRSLKNITIVQAPAAHQPPVQSYPAAPPQAPRPPQQYHQPAPAHAPAPPPPPPPPIAADPASIQIRGYCVRDAVEIVKATLEPGMAIDVPSIAYTTTALAEALNQYVTTGEPFDPFKDQ